jgi:diguanylate cyclase (GGDEF)-like protein
MLFTGQNPSDAFSQQLSEKVLGLSGYFFAEQSYLILSKDIRFGGNEYSVSIVSSFNDYVVSHVKKFAKYNAIELTIKGIDQEIISGVDSVATELSIDVAYKSSTHLNGMLSTPQTRLKILLACSLLFVLIIGLGLAHELTRPLKMLVEATRKIKNGDYSVKVPSMYKDEIGELADTIDRMREHVGEREDEILKLAYADTLTELPNRALFDDKLTTSVDIAKQTGASFAVIVLDLVRFKYVNDVLGHEAGDSVLKEVAARLKTTLRDIDTVARLGGDEFALLLQDVNEKDVLAAVDRIAVVLEDPVTLNNQPIDIGCSIGVAVFPCHGEDSSTLLRRADMAMYSAKRSDQVYSFFDPEFDKHREEHLSLLSEIKRAIHQDELKLYFQPKVTFNDYSILSVETLLRWQHPVRGLIPPDDFIPFAEQTGAIKLITRWLVAKTMKQAREWKDQGLVMRMSLNISARDLLDPEFSDYIQECLDINQVEPQMFCMEITESALMEDPVKARRTVEQLNQMGVSISIDDYGTGYSSLAYVKNLPVNELKIDREFIKNMLENEEDVAIVRSTIDLGHNLGLKVVAEGIEHEEELSMLKEFGCDQAQGYLISRALNAADIEYWISNNKFKLPDSDDPPILGLVG